MANPPHFHVSVTYYVYLALAIALLCFPRGWLRFGVRVTPKPARKVNQHKVERDPYDRSPKPLQEMAKSRNWVDFFRAAAGGGGTSYGAEPVFCRACAPWLVSCFS
jgi:hypothetical protein